jgi:hypothetical protein
MQKRSVKSAESLFFPSLAEPLKAQEAQGPFAPRERAVLIPADRFCFL